MHNFLAIFLFYLSLIHRNSILVESSDVERIESDLTHFNISCDNDQCQFSFEDSLEFQACHCGEHCVQLGTCCIDSPYVEVPQPTVKPSCRYVHTLGYYFIMHKCLYMDSKWASDCNDESSGDDDVQKLVPVTSLMTSITYKNYYCFRCYETGDEFVYWNLRIKRESVPFKVSEAESREMSKRIFCTYSKNENSVMVTFCGGIGYFPVQTKMEIPSEIQNLTHKCEPDVISDCSQEWFDEEIRKKCHSYMAIKEVERVGIPAIRYKNIHCALCNFEILNGISCMKGFRGGFRGVYGGSGIVTTGYTYTGNPRPVSPVYVTGYATGYPKPVSGGGGFSFDAVFNINPSKDTNNIHPGDSQKCSDNEQGCSDGKNNKCSDNEQWNPYAKICKKLTCLVPGFKVQNNKCVKE